MKYLLTALLVLLSCTAHAQESISQKEMERIYNEVRTPYKYGLVVAPSDNFHKFDCPTVFREGSRWFMTYVCYDGKDGTDGRGYETWLAESDDLLHWTTLGRILTLPETHNSNSKALLWDQNQRGGFPALIDWTWGGNYEMGTYKGRHWMTYIGGPGTGYEAVKAPLSIGIASTKGDIATAHQWQTQKKPLLSYADKDAQWWEQLTQYKSTIYSLTPSTAPRGEGSSYIFDENAFIMFYNAGGVNPDNGLKAERIGIATSKDMKHWTRFDGNPVFANEVGGIITGDAQIVLMPKTAVDGSPADTGEQSLYIMFYFKAYDPSRKYNAFNTFAVSHDLIHWQPWNGPDLIYPSKPYDEMFAHKSYVVKHNGVVYHFYCAVNNAQQRGIAVATNVPMGRSNVRFPQPEPTGKRREQSLNEGWTVRIENSEQPIASLVNSEQPIVNSEQPIVNSEQLIVNSYDYKLGENPKNSLDTKNSEKGNHNYSLKTINYKLKTINYNLSLPHNLDDYYGYRQLRHGNLHGSATYARTFTAEKREGKRYFLQFEGVGTYATVTLNGHRYPRELVGRTVWTLDVSDALRNGDNQIEVLVDHPAMQTESPWVCGGCSSEYGFSEGSQPFGIFRPVTLIETAEVRIEPFGVHIWANTACDTVFIDTEIKNYSTNPQYVALVNKLAEKSGKAVFRQSKELLLKPGETRIVRQQSPITNGHRWSPAEPYLYTLTTMLKQPEHHDGDSNQKREPAFVTTDDVRTPFGLRSLSWPQIIKGEKGKEEIVNSKSVNRKSVNSHYSDHRFRINGEPFFINGTCEYEHILGSSHAFSPEQIAARIKMVRNGGFNALREAHQPHNLRYQQLCDEQGLLFWSQFSAHIWYDTPQFRENFKRLLTRWIKERRNSPSIILWGLQNESILPRDFAQECCDIIRSLDPTTVGGDLQSPPQRLITTCNGGEGTDWNVIQNWSGTYGGSAENYAEELSRPDQLLNGEYGAWRTLDLHGDAKYSEESFTALLALKDSLARKAYSGSNGPAALRDSVIGTPGVSVVSESPADTLGVCGHFQWLLCSHDNPGRTQPDGALRRIDKIGPINYKGLLTVWEEPTMAYRRTKSLTPDPSPTGEGSSYSSNEKSNQGKSSIANVYTPLPPEGGAGGGASAGGASEAIYRINCGGDAFTDEYGQQWQADDSILSHSWGQDFEGIHPFQASQRHITADIRGTNSDELFQFFRFGRHRLWYDLPVPFVATESQQTAPLYRIELYFAEPWHGKDDYREEADYEGLRIFDVAVNDSTVIDDLDLWAEAGYCGAVKRVVYAPAKNGRLRISFPEVKAGQAVIAGIVVKSLTPDPSPTGERKGLTPDPSPTGEGSSYSSNEKSNQGKSSIANVYTPLPPEGGAGGGASAGGASAGGASAGGASWDSTFWHSLDTDTIARLPKELLPQDTDPRPATVYTPVPVSSRKRDEATTFTITPGLGQEYALRFRYKNTTGQAVTGRLTITDSKNITLVDRELTFPPTPDKFKMLSTTTGTQINAGTYRLTIDADGVEFKNLEMQ